MITGRVAGRGEETDRELLGGLSGKDSQEAFAELVRRHTPMVLGVCARVLQDRTEAEDAAQAVFMVLWRKHAGLAPDTVLAGWLYRTAELVSRSARKVLARRRKHEREAADMISAPSAQPEASWEEVRTCVDAEMARLPEAQRDVVVLHLVQGRQQKEVAAEMGVHPNTVANRLGRALESLRGRLARRGVHLSAAGLSALLAARMLEPASAQLLAALSSACVAKTAVVSTAGLIAGEALHAMFLAKLKVFTAVAAAAIAAATVTTAGIRHFACSPAEVAPQEAKQLQGKLAPRPAQAATEVLAVLAVGDRASRPTRYWELVSRDKEMQRQLRELAAREAEVTVWGREQGGRFAAAKFEEKKKRQTMNERSSKETEWSGTLAPR